MKRTKSKILAGLVLSVLMAFTMVPQAAFATGDEVTVNVFVKNLAFVKELATDDGSKAVPAWTGVHAAFDKVTIAKGQTLGEAIMAEAELKAEGSASYITGFDGLSSGLGIVDPGFGYDMSGFTFFINTEQATAGIDAYGNEAKYIDTFDGNKEKDCSQIADGTNIDFFYSVYSNQFVDKSLLNTKVSKVVAKKKAIQVRAKKPTGVNAKFQFAYKAAGAKKWTVKKSSKGAVTIKGLKSGKKYSIKVRAVSDVGMKVMDWTTGGYTDAPKTTGAYSKAKTVRVK